MGSLGIDMSSASKRTVSNSHVRRNSRNFEAERSDIEELLVGEDDIGGVAQEGNALERVIAKPTVGTHDLLFVVSEHCGLVKNRVGDGYLADIKLFFGAVSGEILALSRGQSSGEPQTESKRLTEPISDGIGKVRPGTHISDKSCELLIENPLRRTRPWWRRLPAVDDLEPRGQFKQ